MSYLSAALLLLSLLPGVAFAAELGSARISLTKGDVQIYTADTQDWVAATINMPLREGDRFWVPSGARAEIQLQGGVYIRIDSGTAFDLLTLQEESFQFYLNGGNVYINNRKGGIDHIQVDTPQSSIGCFDNSLVMIDVAENGATAAAVLKGYVAVENNSGKTEVEAGNEIHMGSDLSAEIYPLTPPDEWENWNRVRDKKLVAGNRSLRYIPDELDEYAYELDDYGKWVYVTDFGYCWTPRNVSADWAPYQNGRWVWLNGDYVWVASEPWGWVPHHYGRWTFVVNFGWCWVPPRTGVTYWSPGYVGWVHTPTAVAWVPLAPGDIFYGRGNFGPASVNISNVHAGQNGNRHYRNINVRNGVTVVSTTAFISGHRERARGWKNPFKEANISIGQPVIKPNKRTSMPTSRTIPAARKPPERVKRISLSEIRKERAVVREAKGSVFKPGQPGAQMPVKRRNELRQNKIHGPQPVLPAAKPVDIKQTIPKAQVQPVASPAEKIQLRPQKLPSAAAPVKQPAARQPEPDRGRPEPDRGRPEPDRGRPAPAKAALRPEQPKAAVPAIMPVKPPQPVTPVKAPAPQHQPAAPAKAPVKPPQSVAPVEVPAPQPQPAAAAKVPVRQVQPVPPVRVPPVKAEREPRWQEPIPAPKPHPAQLKVAPKPPVKPPVKPLQPSPGKGAKEPVPVAK